MGEQNRAFTLAEVLITLTIIGVVSAMTIPNLLKNTNDSEYKAAWKKIFSEISQASTSVVDSYGGNIKGLSVTDTNIRDEYAKYLSVIKKCDNGFNDGCRAEYYNYLSGSTKVNWHNGQPTLILKNGASTTFYYTNTCNIAGLSTCIQMYIDVNGPKPPNTFGKDVYGLDVDQRGRTIPWGVTDGSGSTSDHACDKNNSGIACSSVYLNQ